MKRYIQRNPVAQAMQFTGENEIEILEWIKTFNKEVYILDGVVKIAMKNNTVFCEKHEYVVKENDNPENGDTATVMTEAQFLSVFKPLDPSEPNTSIIPSNDRVKRLKEDVIKEESSKAENYHFGNGGDFSKIFQEGENFKIDNGSAGNKTMFSIKDYNNGTLYISRFYDKNNINSGDSVEIHIPQNQRGELGH